VQPVTKPLPRCADCGLPYGCDGWIDAVVPDRVWAVIGPCEGGGGLLCVNCTARRLHMWGLSNVPVVLASGPFNADLSLVDVSQVEGLRAYEDHP
jgi:hypothetical protein